MLEPTTQARPEAPGGGRRISEETRARLREISRARYAAMTPEQQAAQLARLRHGTPKPPAPATEPEGRPSLFDDAPRAAAAPARAEGLNGQDRAAGPPIFRVPELPPLELGDQAAPEGAIAPELAGPGISEAQVARLVRMPFEFVAIRRGKHWKLQDEEAEFVAGALASKLNEHAVTARAIGAGGDWVVIFGGLSLLVWERLEEDQRRHDRNTAADDGAGARRVSPPGNGRDRDPGHGPDGRRGVGFLNGFALPGGPPQGPDDGPPDAVAPGGPLVQAL